MKEYGEADRRTAAELGMGVEEVLRVLEVWEKHSEQVDREKSVARHRKEPQEACGRMFHIAPDTRAMCRAQAGHTGDHDHMGS